MLGAHYLLYRVNSDVDEIMSGGSKGFKVRGLGCSHLSRYVTRMAALVATLQTPARDLSADGFRLVIRSGHQLAASIIESAICSFSVLHYTVSARLNLGMRRCFVGSSVQFYFLGGTPPPFETAVGDETASVPIEIADIDVAPKIVVIVNGTLCQPYIAVDYAPWAFVYLRYETVSVQTVKGFVEMT